jgi:hypothetical protein
MNVQVTEEPREQVDVAMPSAAGWFSIRLLLATGVQALVSKLIGARTARREILAALDSGTSDETATNFASPEGYFDYRKTSHEREGLWIDYVADLGDGFNATHSVSWLVGRDYVFLDTPGASIAQPIPRNATSEAGPADGGSSRHVLPAGEITIFGGDEVYPFASKNNYATRTCGPYHAARPWSGDPDDGKGGAGGRDLFVIPGNHDWYDGLGSFIRNFCQPGRWIGCWQIKQRRSYFSLRLPHGFWLWGVDMATEDDIDPPQLAYFERQAKQLESGDQVILCVPKPAWVACEQEPRQESETWEAWNKIEKLASLVIEPIGRNASVPLIVAGDLHHYSRHSSPGDAAASDRHLVTCGGGGAFMLGTSTIPRQLAFPDGSCTEHRTAFPSKDQSDDMRNGVFKLFVIHKTFCAALATIMLTLIWLFHSASRQLMSVALSADAEQPLIETPFLACARQAVQSLEKLGRFLTDVLAILVCRPGVAGAVLAVALGFVAFAYSGASRRTPRWAPPLIGLSHFLVQFLLSLIVATVLSTLLIAATDNPFIHVPALVVLSIACCWPINGLMTSVYMWASNYVANMHEQEIFSAQAIEDWKCFLRMRVNKDGLTIFPIGLRKIERTWQVADGMDKIAQTRMTRWLRKALGAKVTVDVAKNTTHIFHPAEPLAPELIEEPVFIRPRRGTNS